MVRSPRPKPTKSPRSARGAFYLPWRELLDVLALGTWSMMLFRYWFGGKLLLLLHPDYAWLSNTAAVVLAATSLYKLFNLLRGQLKRSRAQRKTAAQAQKVTDDSHVTLLPRNLSSLILLGVAVFGLIYTPVAFASQTATQRGIADTLTLTRAQPQRFARAAAPAERSIIDWIRLVNVYPEPDEYTDEPVDLEGFVIYPETWPPGYVMVSRFVLTCCAADAYPVGLPVKLPDSQLGDDRPYPVASWLAISGTIVTDTLDGRRQVAIAHTEIRTIEEPKNPYEY
ncbi:MAG: TIGR03943 family protein [Phormidesmis sp.]